MNAGRELKADFGSIDPRQFERLKRLGYNSRLDELQAAILVWRLMKSSSTDQVDGETTEPMSAFVVFALDALEAGLLQRRGETRE
jgi:hypothetical protein